MAQQQFVAVENNFTKGLITESTGLNFPENAATDTDNCEYTLIGDVLRREGINFEANFSTNAIVKTGNAISTYKWNNAGGDGNTQLLVAQVGGNLFFFNITAATATSPISTKILGNSVDLTPFIASGGSLDTSLECTYADGNGYLFVYHPNCNPFYVTYAGGFLGGTTITLQVRDFTGVSDSLDVNTRPSSLSAEHSYNLVNQGWIAVPAWIANSTPQVIAIGSQTLTVQAGLGVTLGQIVSASGVQSGIFGTNGAFGGTVTGYAGTSLTINVTSLSPPLLPGTPSAWTIVPTNTGYISTWFTAEGNYPSNSDQWWRFKNASDVFDPATTQPNTSISLGQAPQGHFIFPAFNVNRSATSGIAGLTSVSTTARPSIGAWFQGRVWYAGTNANSAASGDAPAYSWSESIYFSQVNISTPNNFGSCYQVNDPTSQELFDILPTDGGVITIHGCGRIFKLFPTQNGMLVFAANGVWFITGSQGIGFSANDYTITNLSNVESISSTSFVNVMGLPYFWNEEGIYAVEAQKTGGLAVNPITVGTILSFYNNIPKQSKKYVRGAYHPIDYIIQWIYKSVDDTSVVDRYSFDRILNYNTYNKSFFPYSVGIDVSSINGINYIQGPGGSGTPDPVFKYLCNNSGSFSFAEEYDTNYVDWASAIPENYVSYFITGYKLRGQAIKKFQPQYIQLYCKTNGAASAYKLQGLWDFANSRNSGRWSSVQLITNALTRFDTVFNRRKIRGHGFALQFKITSVDGMPFDLQGWAVTDSVNAGT